MECQRLGQPLPQTNQKVFASHGRGSTPMGSHFRVGAPPMVVYFSGGWEVHSGYGVLTHSHMKGKL